MIQREYNSCYEEEYLSRVAFPLGGIGAGMFALEGTGALSHFSIQNKPDMHNEPMIFAALNIGGPDGASKIIEGQVPMHKIFTTVSKNDFAAPSHGLHGTTYGLPRYEKAKFHCRFPFGYVDLEDSDMPVKASICGWSPFIPGKPDESGLPLGVLEYELTNVSDRKQECTFSFHSMFFLSDSWGFMKEEKENTHRIYQMDKGFCHHWFDDGEDKSRNGYFAVTTDDSAATVDCAWFRGSWFDPITQVWKHIQDGDMVSNPPHTGYPGGGSSIYSKHTLLPGESKKISINISWYFPKTTLCEGKPKACSGECADSCQDGSLEFYKPYYSTIFESIESLNRYWHEKKDEIRQLTKNFADAFYSSQLPPEIMEAASANLSILKSPTVLRQHDGRIWAWEGCCDKRGSCHGSCTHVWNYAQAMPHLFPSLERTLRQTEFDENQDDEGHQMFRSTLPIKPIVHDFYAAADGQLGGIMKVYRDYIISGDINWLKSMWPKVKDSLDYCINKWDYKHKGILEQPHHNTYDIEFWGPNGMSMSFYLGALKAACMMGEVLSEDTSLYERIFQLGKEYMETELFNGEYFYQKIKWKGLGTEEELYKECYDEAKELIGKEGPKYQYGNGCLSDGVLGAWMAMVCYIGEILDPVKVKSHLLSVYKYNFKKSLKNHVNPQRPGYALQNEGGLLLCTWPNGGKPSLPFVYCDEVWTGIEYHVAAHLMMHNEAEKALEIVRTCRRRYDGRYRNPFNEYECGSFYARAMSSFSLIYAYTGVRYDAVKREIINEGFGNKGIRSFLATSQGYEIIYPEPHGTKRNEK